MARSVADEFDSVSLHFGETGLEPAFDFDLPLIVWEARRELVEDFAGCFQRFGAGAVDTGLCVCRLKYVRDPQRCDVLC